MIQFPDQPATDYTDPNGVDWIYNGTGWARKPAGGAVSPNPYVAGQPIIYEWDSFSLYNGIYSGIYPDSTAAPVQMGSAMRINNENHLMSTVPDASITGFYWVRNNGSKVTEMKYLPYISGENGQGNIGGSTLKTGMSRRSVVIGDEVYILAGSSNVQDLIKVTYDGAELIGSINTHEETDEWHSPTTQYCANADGTRPMGLIQSSDTEFTVAISGISKDGSKSYPRLKVITFSKEDCSITNTYYSDVDLTYGVAGYSVSYPEFFPDPRDPKKLIVISPYIWKDASPSYFHIVVYYIDTEAGTIETIDLGKGNSTYRVAIRGLKAAQIIPLSEDLYSVEILGQMHGYNESASQTYYVKLPADRQNMSGKVSAGMNPHVLKREGKGYYTTYGANDLEIDRENYGLAMHKSAVMQTLTSFAHNMANTARTSMYERNSYNQIINHYPFAHHYRGYAKDGGSLDDGLEGGWGMVDISPAMIAPDVYFLRDTSTRHYVCLLGWRPDTGAAIFALQDTNTKTQYIILVNPKTPSNLRTMARVKDGKVVEGPLRGLEAGVDTSGDDWFRVYPETKEVTTFGEVENGDYTKFVSDELVFDEDAGKVIQFFDEVAMTDVEVAEAKAMEAEELAMRAGGESE